MSRDEDTEAGFEQFERFLREWSRRDFLKRAGGAAAYMTFLAGGVEFLEACAGGGTGTQSATPKKGGHVVEGNFSDVRTFNSMLSSDTASNQVIGLMFDGLLNSKATGELVPALASDMPKVSSDGMTYTFKLRSGLKWSDGKPITSEDVKFTYSLAQDPAYKDVASPRRGDLSKYIKSIDTPDPQTVVFTMTQVFAPFLASHGQYGILPKHVLGTLDAKAINTADFNTAPSVSNGAFKFVKWDKGAQVTLERNDNYWAGAPYLDQWIYKVLPDSVAVTNQLKTGEIDIGPVDPGQADSLKGVDSVTMTEFPVAIFTFYAYQLDPAKTTLFQDKAVRQALAYALDRDSMVKAIDFGLAQVAVGTMPVLSWAYAPDKITNKYPFDINKANQLLDQAGWAKGPDGIRAKDGKKLSFTLWTNAGNTQRGQYVTVMQQMWKAIGVDASPKTEEWNAYITRITETHDFEIFLVGFGWQPDPDQTSMWSCDAYKGGFNLNKYCNPQVDDLLAKGLSTLDQAQRKQYYEQMENLLMDDLPSMILDFPKATSAVNKRVHNLTPNAINVYWDAHLWWVDDGK